MNYQKIYDSIIDRSKSRSRPDCYCEKHHIVPKCMGGLDSKDNIAILTAREHFIAHKLICKIYPDNIKLRFALVCMSSNGSKSAVGHTVSSSEYQRIRESYSHALKKNHPRRGIKLSKDMRLKISECSPRLSGKDHPMFGRKHSEETKEKMRVKSKRSSGKDHPMYGKSHSEETREKMSESQNKTVTSRWNYDKNHHHLRNKETGETFIGTRYDFCKKYSASSTCGGISRLLSGKQKTFKGWYVFVSVKGDHS